MIGDNLSEVGREVGVPPVSVVILNYNGLGFAEQCVRSVLDSDYPSLEVVVVHNTDGSYEVLSQSFGMNLGVSIIRNERNLGFAEGNNVGYRKSKGVIVVFLNVDTRVERKWLSELVRALTSDAKVGGAQSKLVTLRERNRLDSLGFYMDALGFVYLRACESSSFSVGEPFYPDGASMAFRRSVLEEAALDGRPFHRDYFLYFEDNDLGWRVRLRGYSIVLVPSSVAYHFKGGSASSITDYVRIFSFAKNRLVTLIKNHSLRNLIRFLPLVVLLEMALAVFLLPEEPAKSMAKLRALLWRLSDLGKIWRKHVFVQSRIRAVPDSEIIRHMIPPNFSTLRQTFVTLH